MLGNGSDRLTVTANGSFTFATSVLSGAQYSVSVVSQPVGQTCTASNNSGTVTGADVNSVSVVCSSSAFTVGGMLSGLTSGKSVTLLNNSGNPLTLSANGNFSFSTKVADGAGYAVTLATQPVGQTCSVSSGTGTVSGANVTTVLVVCSTASYTVGGTLSGLGISKSIGLRNNGGDDLILTSNTNFTFATPVPSAGMYNVTVFAQPVGEMCTVTNGSGTIGTSNVTSVQITCVPNQYAVGGTLTGLIAGRALILTDNPRSDNLQLTANGPFTFSTKIPDQGTYNVTVLVQPAGQTCTVTNGSGTVNLADVNTISVNCTANPYTVGGTLTGMDAAHGKSIVLQDNLGDDLTLTANGGFTFANPVASGQPYSVTVATQPRGETCTVSNGSGTVGGSNVNSVQVSCIANTYTVGGTLIGLISGRSIFLQDNGGSTLQVSANGTFTFGTKVADQGAYNVTVSSPPSGETCTVTNGSGTVDAANVTSVSVSCVANAYTIGGTLSGLNSGKSIVLQNNGGDNLTLTAGGAFAFPTSVLSGGNYAVTIATPPTGETCSIFSGSGTVTSGNIGNVNVSCTTNSYNVGGTISGLSAGTVSLNFNGVIYGFSANGSFTLPAKVPDEGNYSVTVASQPTGQLCTITNGSGTVHAADVTNILVNCVAVYSIGGSVNYLAPGKSVVLQVNGAETKTVTGFQNSKTMSFTFSTLIPSGTNYSVAVLTPPAGQTCTVTNGTGTVNGANVTNVAVNCSSLVINISASNLIGGTVRGMYVYSGTSMAAVDYISTLDSSGHYVSSNLFSATAGQQNFANPSSVFTPNDGSYTVFISVDKGPAGITPGTGASNDDLHYLGTVQINGPTTLFLGNSNFKPYVAYNPTISNPTTVANFNFFCSIHLPGTDIFADGIQRNSIGRVRGQISGAGVVSILNSVAPQGTFDFTCMADNPNPFSGGVELQPFDLQTGNGLDLTSDYLVTVPGVTISGTGSVPITFAASTSSSGPRLCTGTYLSGGNGTPGVGQFNGDNNQAVLKASASCAPTGQGTPTTKTITLIPGSGTGSYSFGAVVASRQGNSDSFQLVIPFTNMSGSAKSGITVMSAAVKDGNGNTLSNPTVTAVGSACGASIVPNCLANGESGYLLSAGSGYANAASVTFSMTDSTSAPGLAPKVIPQSYTVFDGLPPGSRPELRIRVANVGVGNADVLANQVLTPSLWYVTMDDVGNPNGWGTMFRVSNHVIVPPCCFDPILGTSAPLNSAVFSTLSSSFSITSQIKVFMVFSGTTSAPTPTAVGSLFEVDQMSAAQAVDQNRTTQEPASPLETDWWRTPLFTESAVVDTRR